MRALPSSVFTRSMCTRRSVCDGQVSNCSAPPGGDPWPTPWSPVATNASPPASYHARSRYSGAPSALADAPYVKSLYYVAGPAGQSVSFKVRSLDPATSYSVTSLPDSLSLNSAVGEISGSLPVAGAHEVSITATNDYGSGSEFTLYLVAE